MTTSKTAVVTGAGQGMGRAIALMLAGHGIHVVLVGRTAGEALIKPIEETTDADWDRILSINLKGPFLMARALLPLLRKSENASIINIGSKATLGSFGGITAYSASKTGLLGLTRSLSAELRQEEIRVVILCPGPADTPMRWAATPEIDPHVLITPEVVADTVWMLVSLPRGTTTDEFLLQSMHFD